jgi:uncharacterized membrane protein YeaQ/YmgE (transglycosylase-associated protein family)
MGCVSWIIFGAIAGWLASLIMGRNKQMGCMANVFAGIVGAGLGGIVANLLGADADVTGFNLTSFIVAVFGAMILLGLTGWWSRRS